MIVYLANRTQPVGVGAYDDPSENSSSMGEFSAQTSVNERFWCIEPKNRFGASRAPPPTLLL